MKSEDNSKEYMEESFESKEGLGMRGRERDKDRDTGHGAVERQVSLSVLFRHHDGDGETPSHPLSEGAAGGGRRVGVHPKVVRPGAQGWQLARTVWLYTISAQMGSPLDWTEIRGSTTELWKQNSQIRGRGYSGMGGTHSMAASSEVPPLQQHQWLGEPSRTATSLSPPGLPLTIHPKLCLTQIYSWQTQSTARAAAVE